MKAPLIRRLAAFFLAVLLVPPLVESFRFASFVDVVKRGLERLTSGNLVPSPLPELGRYSELKRRAAAAAAPFARTSAFPIVAPTSAVPLEANPSLLMTGTVLSTAKSFPLAAGNTNATSAGLPASLHVAPPARVLRAAFKATREASGTATRLRRKGRRPPTRRLLRGDLMGRRTVPDQMRPMSNNNGDDSMWRENKQTQQDRSRSQRPGSSRGARWVSASKELPPPGSQQFTTDPPLVSPQPVSNTPPGHPFHSEISTRHSNDLPAFASAPLPLPSNELRGGFASAEPPALAEPLASQFQLASPDPRLPSERRKTSNVVALRSWSMGDVSAFVALVSNEAVHKFMRNDFPLPYSSAARAFITVAGDPLSIKRRGNHAFLAITVNGEVAGGIGLSFSQFQPHDAEIGYWLGEQFWGHGIMTTAIAKMSELGFQRWNLQRIHATVIDKNVASIRALQKNEFGVEGHLRSCYNKEGVLHNAVALARLTPNWAAMCKPPSLLSSLGPVAQGAPINLVLRPFVDSDLDELCVAGSDPAIEKFTLPNTREATSKFLKQAAAPEAGCQYFAVELDGGLAGGAVLRIGPDMESHAASIGYWVREPLWGNGIGTNIVRQLCGIAQSKGLLRVAALVHSDNGASRRVLQKCGFTEEGALLGAWVRHDGTPLTLVQCGLMLSSGVRP